MLFFMKYPMNDSQGGAAVAVSSDDIADEIIAAYHTVWGMLHTVTIASWLDLDLSMAQLKTLFVVARAETVSVGQMAETLRVGMPTASHLIERLVQEGLVERTIDNSDRRRALAGLTPQGAQLVARLRQGSRSQLRSWVDALDTDDRAALLTGMRAIAQVAANTPHPSSELE